MQQQAPSRWGAQDYIVDYASFLAAQILELVLFRHIPLWRVLSLSIMIKGCSHQKSVQHAVAEV